jgi:hypothetical protein
MTAHHRHLLERYKNRKLYFGVSLSSCSIVNSLAFLCVGGNSFRPKNFSALKMEKIKNLENLNLKNNLKSSS